MEPVKKKRNYIDNAALYKAYEDWYAAIEKAVEEGKPEPQPPALIQHAIMEIPRRLAQKGNFVGYSYKDEMIADAIEDMVRGIRKFDLSKSKNPFAYFTQVSYFAFIRRILRERDHAYIKHRLIQHSGIIDNMSMQEEDDDGEFKVSFLETLQMNLNPDLEAYYEKKHPPRKKRERKIENSIEDILARMEAVDAE